jgi:electron transport complex protein RnfC
MRDLTLQRRLLGGLRLVAHKHRSTRQPILRGLIPSQLILPLNLPRGATATPLVAVGDRVLGGQPVANDQSPAGEVIHASTSGQVTAIEPRPVVGPPGSVSPAIVIRADGEDRSLPHAAPATESSDAACVLRRVRNGGIVGLGGALFPTADKLAPHPGDLTLVLNGAECEPYISCDDMLMQEQAKEVVAGAVLMSDLAGAARCIVAIERDKPAAIAAMAAGLNAIGDDRFELAQVPTVYPAGGERQLIQLLAGIEIPSGRFPTDIGFICQNVATAVALYRVLRLGTPLTSRIVTITGQGVTFPQNVEARIGAPIAELIEQIGGYEPQVSHLIMGGTMMGIALETDAVPVTKATNCIIAATAAEVYQQGEQMPCIRCGDCAEVCPARLLPQELIRSLNAQDPDTAASLGLSDCIECGCCDVVCPSHIPLTEGFRAGKHAFAILAAERAAAARAEARVSRRAQRLEKTAAEETLARQDLQAAVRGDRETRQEAVREVLARARQREIDHGQDGS